MGLEPILQCRNRFFLEIADLFFTLTKNIHNSTSVSTFPPRLNLYPRWDSNPQILHPKCSAYSNSATRALILSICLPNIKYFIEQMMGIEPTYPAWKAGILTVVLHLHFLCCWLDLNQRPPHYQCGALTNWATATFELVWPVTVCKIHRIRIGCSSVNEIKIVHHHNLKN